MYLHFYQTTFQSSCTYHVIFPSVLYEDSNVCNTWNCCPVIQSCPTLCSSMDSECQASLSITKSQTLLRLFSTEPVMPSNHLILCHPLLPSIFPSSRVFSNESAICIRWPKYWSFSFSSSPSNEHPGLISFRMDWLDLLAVQGTLKSLLQHHSSKASSLLCFSFRYSPTLTSMHGHWKIYSLD